MSTGSTVEDLSFISVDDADVYFENLFNVATWSTATDANKQKALNSATQKIKAVPYIDYDNIDDEDDEDFDADKLSAFEIATAEEALSLLKGDSVHLQNQSLGIESVSLAGDSVKYNKQVYLQSPIAQNLLKKYIKGAFKVV